jgi:hypothetical protein
MPKKASKRKDGTVKRRSVAAQTPTQPEGNNSVKEAALRTGPGALADKLLSILARRRAQ